MTVSPLQAAKYICKLSGWSLSNLQLQKILYIAQMFHLGEHEGPLMHGHFEAWDYGPVQPDIYHKLKIFGANHVEDFLFSTEDIKQDRSEAELLNKIVPKLLIKEPWELVSITHWEKGAWVKNYGRERGRVITNEDILEEYNVRQQVAKDRKQT